MTYFKSVKKNWKSLLTFTVLATLMTALMKAAGTNKQWVLDIFGTDLNATIGVACVSGLITFALFSFLHWATEPAR